MKHKLLFLLMLAGFMPATPGLATEATTMGGRLPNEYTARIMPAVVANDGLPVHFSLTLLNVTPLERARGGCSGGHDEGGCDGGCGDDHDEGGCDGGCGDDHDEGGCDGGCGDDHDEGGCDGGCGDDHDEGGCDGGCGDDHDEGGCDGGCGDDHDEGGCEGGCGDEHDDGSSSHKASGPGWMAVKKITLFLPEGISIDQMRNISYYTMPCGRQWTRKEPEATDRIVFVASHGPSHRLGPDQAFVLTFDLLTPYEGELQWVTELSHCPGSGGRPFQLVSMPGNLYSDASPVTVMYSPGREQLAGGGYIQPLMAAGSHAPAPGTSVYFVMNAMSQKIFKRTGFSGQVTLNYCDAEGTRWHFQTDRPLDMGINKSYGTGVGGAYLAVSGRLKAGNQVIDQVVLQALLVDGKRTGTPDEIAITLRQQDKLLLSTHWENKFTSLQQLGAGNITIIAGGTPAGAGMLQEDAPVAEGLMMEVDQPGLQLTVFPNPFRERLHFRFAPAEDVRVVLELYDISGALITTLFDQQVGAGQLQQLEYVPENRSAGMIFYRLMMGNDIRTGKVMVQD